MSITPYRKAIVSAVAAGSAALVTALSDEVVTSGEWVTIALAVVGALGITWAVPNAEPTYRPPLR